jgi:hypothetical protein
MALQITRTGKPLVAGDDDVSITFDDIGLSWVAEGYDLYLQITNPCGTISQHQLSTVVGDLYAAKLASVSGLVENSGLYIFKLLAYDAGTSTNPKILSVDYYEYVRP